MSTVNLSQTASSPTRGKYNEIPLSTLLAKDRTMLENLIQQVSANPDEHADSWNFGATFDAKGRGSALNWDLYAIGRDVHSRRFLALIQVRQYSKAHKNWYPQIRKNYLLLGRNEDGSAFAHSIEAQVVHAAIRTGKDVIQAAQSWIFGGESYRDLVRQGDIALSPRTRKPKGEAVLYLQARKVGDFAGYVALIEGSHALFCDALLLDEAGNAYALNPALLHTPGQHPSIPRQAGWFRVVTGQRANYWRFAPPSKD